MDFEALYRTERVGLEVHVVLACGASYPAAQDAAQTAFVKLLQRGDSVLAPRAWLRVVAVNEYVKAALHTAHRRRATVEQLLAPEDFPDLDRGLSASDLSEIRAESERVVSAFNELPDKQRLVMAWHYDGATTAEIAVCLGITEAAVRKNLSRARRTLQTLLATTWKDNT